MLRIAWLALGVCLLAASSAGATSFTFHCIAGDGGGPCAIPGDELWVDVADAGAGQFSLTLHNESGARAPLTELYLEDRAGLIAHVVSIVDGPGVAFALGGAPPVLPSGTLEGFETSFSFVARNPKPRWGVGTGESLTIVFSLAEGVGYAELIAAMQAGTLRVGIHAPPLAPGGNKSFVTGGSSGGGALPAPEPGSVALLAAAASAWLLRRRRSCKPGEAGRAASRRRAKSQA